MELSKQDNGYSNSLGEVVDLEPDYLYPMLKGSQLANGLIKKPALRMLITQRHTGEDTKLIKRTAPKTWQYLINHQQLLDRRRSSIYKNRPKFSVFGVGNYTFANWKVAISGFYKNLDFKLVGPYENKPVVLDDTCYFIGCRNKKEAELLLQALNSDIAKDFYSAFIFWDEKRPITINILGRLNIYELCKKLGIGNQLSFFRPQLIDAGLFEQIPTCI